MTRAATNAEIVAQRRAEIAGIDRVLATLQPNNRGYITVPDDPALFPIFSNYRAHVSVFRRWRAEYQNEIDLITAGVL